MKLSKKVYLPITADMFHIGHLRAIKQCARYGTVFIGLIDCPEYKDCVIPYKQRREILESIPEVYKIVKQNSLNPLKNLTKIKPDYMASGDGFELIELLAMALTKVNPLKIKYCSEISTSRIKEKLCQKY